ncbi:MAG TPA: ABC transporter substrate-binding protein [Candidatus Binatia bacterium]|jgi:ABC-type nitrate/sulfonate/bicarbonate transport system substrate-binding protein
MSDYQPLEIHAFYRSHTHLPVWEVVEKAGIWKELNVKASFEYCDSSSVAEAALFDGTVQYVSGNHISPYGLVAKRKPIVSLASPSNSVNDKLISRAPIKSIAELKGKRLADTTVTDKGGGYNHIRGNHMMYVLKAGLRLDDVKWVEIADIMSEEFRAQQMEAVKEGKADAAMATGAAEKFQKEGFHVLELGRLPMVNGPTLTSTLTTLKNKDRLAERLVKALVMGIAYARQHREETERILAGLRRRVPESNATYNSVAKLLAKPYPDHEAIANAYELCCMKDPKAKELSPVSLWDLHFLRELDDSGFIDGLYARK